VTFKGDLIEDPAAEFKREEGRVAAWAKENGVELRPFTFHHLCPQARHSMASLRRESL
jgi:hypothetical protein